MAGTGESEVVERLFEAVGRWDQDAVDEILREHPKIVNVRREAQIKDATPLLEACQTGALDIIKVLLRHGADVCCTGRMGGYHHHTSLKYHTFEGHSRREGGYGACDDVFPLYVATSTVMIHVIEELIEAGADLNQTTAAGQSALHVASKNRDGSLLARFAKLGYKPKRKLDAADLMSILIDRGANVNLQDNMGRTPLHYACMCHNLYSIKLLLEKGADPGIRDNFGMSILEVAAHKNYDLMENLLKLCPWSDKEKIEAYEIAALAGDHDSCPSILKGMSKATYLRVELNCPKTVLDPLKCFGNMKEWGTLCDIERLKENFQALKEQCMIARERIYQGRRYPLDEGKVTEVFMGVQNRVQQNALLRHYLQVFRRNEDYLYFADYFVKESKLLKCFATAQGIDIPETATIVAIIKLSFESASRIKNALGVETKRGAILQFIGQFEKVLLTAGAYILMLFHRARHFDEFKSDDDLARSLLKELIEDFPYLFYSATGYYNPLLNIMLNRRYGAFATGSYPVLPDVGMIEMMLDYESVDVNKADSEGNTALHVAISPFPTRPIDSGDGSPLRPDPYCTTESLVRLLLDKGAYVYARNKSKQTVFDILNDPEHADFYSHTPNLSKMLEEYHGLPTLKRLTAEYLSDAKITLESQLPVALKDFVSLH